MTESNFEIEIKKRARRRMKGALVLVLISLATLPFLIRPAPQTQNQSLIINIVRPNVPDNAFNIAPLTPPSMAEPSTLPNTSATVVENPPTPAEAMNEKPKPPPALIAEDVETPRKIYLYSPRFSNTQDLLKLTNALDKAKIDYQKKPDINEMGKAELTLIFGAYSNPEKAQQAQKLLLSKFKDLKKLSMVEQ